MINFMRRINWQERLYRYQWWMVAAVVLVTTAICYALLLEPVWQRYQDTTQEASQHQGDLSSASSNYTAAVEARRLWDGLTARYGKEFLTAQSPDSRDLVVLSYFSRVQDIATSVGVTLEDINQVPGEGEG